MFEYYNMLEWILNLFFWNTIETKNNKDIELFMRKRAVKIIEKYYLKYKLKLETYSILKNNIQKYTNKKSISKQHIHNNKNYKNEPFLNKNNFKKY